MFKILKTKICFLPGIIALLLPTYLIRFSIFGVPTTVLEIAIYGMAIIVLINFQFSLRPRSGRAIFNFFILLLLAGAVAGAIIAPDKRVAFGQLKAYFIDPLLVFWLIQKVKKIEKVEKVIKGVVWGLLISGLVVAGHAIYQKITGQLTVDGRVVGLFGYSSNYLAMYLAPVLVISLISQIGRIRQIRLISLISLICLIGLYFSGSRGGWLGVFGALAAAGGWLASVKWPVYRRQFIAATITIILLGLIVIGYAFRFQPDDLGRAGSSNNLRIMTWQASWRIIKEKPFFGVGLGNFQNYFTAYTKDWPNYVFVAPQALHSHNIFLTFWLETGLLGLLGFLGIITIFFHRAFSLKPSAFNITVVAAMAAILFHGLVDTTYFKNDLAVMFWLLVGLIL